MYPLTPDDPRTVGPHRLLARLGAGGMGKVYLARTPGGDLAAVKLVKDDLAHDPEFRARFAREVRAARRVRGPFTPAVVDADTDAEVPWMAAEYVPAPTLKEAVREHGPLPPESLPVLVSGLARALDAVHEAGLMHRDLKPGNVLLSPRGPQVIDFGLARAVEGTVLTRTGQSFGTPAYTSPEQIKGRNVSPASDVFSLAGTVLFAASGEPPFGPALPKETLRRILSDTPNLSAVPEGPLRDLLARCLAKGPEHRPNTAAVLKALADVPMPQTAHAWLPDEVTDDVHRLREQQAEERTRADRARWRRPVLIAGAAAATLVLVAGGGYALTALPEGSEEPAEGANTTAAGADGTANGPGDGSAAGASAGEETADPAFAPEEYQQSLSSADGVTFSPDGERVYATGSLYLSVWDWRAGEITDFLDPSPSETDINADATMATVHADGVGSAHQDRIELLRDTDGTLTQETVLVYEDQRTNPRNPALSSDGTRVAVVANEPDRDDIEHVIHVWDVPAGERVLTIPLLGPDTFTYVFDLEFTADGGMLVGTVSDDSERVLGVAVWDAVTGDWVHYFEGPGNLGFAPHPTDPSVMALLEDTDRVRLVDLGTGSTLRDLGRIGEDDPDAGFSLAFSSNGERLYAGVEDPYEVTDLLGTVWDTATGEVLRDGDVLLPGPVGPHPRDEFLAVLDTDAGQVLVLDGENLTVVNELH
ncbi:WD40 repeat domain-containing serine/threonine protein kinase [Nocardiopsis tropica]|uniref:WD40 repeat domain-containing serine/threonine protein kinase n=1 Tax=Nocardiopsis tropica TaxID=109330 RepID=A0ABU7KTU6_9ACTN|nr:WD40 repeat domain-containing serine/threonine protein kinase [Nocardiopsis umidischolae]MEE2052424.1 WD40 repeat domain-containing serine/threonine protein kinase [Nocardiopsis umidischolae]